MARQRMINPDFWLDEDLGKCTQSCRLLYIGTWNHSDDYGVIENSPVKMKAQIFPYDDIEVKPLVEKLISLKKLLPFEVDGKKYLYIKNFLKYQKVDKPSKYRYAPPPQELFDDCSESAIRPLKAEEKRREVKRREENYSDEFMFFWNMYPKKVGKPKTYELWLKLSEKQKKLIDDDVPKRKMDEKWVNGFIKDPERYIKSEQWEDDIKITSRETLKI